MVCLNSINISENFPTDIKLSYENISHKKVSKFDFVMAIPEGKKCFVWFSSYSNNDECILLEATNLSIIKKIKVNFNKDFLNEKGTIFYGTTFYYNNKLFFTIEDICYYKGENIVNKKYIEKLKFFRNIFNNNMFYNNNNDIIFGLPIIEEDINKLFINIRNLYYKISHIQYRYYFQYGGDSIECIPFRQPYNYTNNNNQLNKPKQLIFKVKADIQNDIYHLYNFKDNTEQFFDIAYIPDYKTSVMMNNLFRTIKENNNLDALEESDDEDEFENENIDKFVNLNMHYYIWCEYNYIFKKWTPIKVSTEKEMKI